MVSVWGEGERQQCAAAPSPSLLVTTRGRCYRCSHLHDERRWRMRYERSPLAAKSATTAEAAGAVAVTTLSTSSSCSATTATGRGEWRMARRRTDKGRGWTFGRHFVLFALVALAILDCNLSSALIDFGDPFADDPRFVTPLQNITVQLGSPFKLICIANAGPLPQMLMHHNGMPLSTSFAPDQNSKSNYDELGLEFAVEVAEIKHSGVYRCQVQSSKGHVATTTSYVKVTGEGKPVLRAINNQVITEGAPVKLQCIADGLPRPIIEWTVPDHVIVGQDIQINNTHGTVIISSAKLTHEGSYRCQATNRYGVANRTVKLTVIDHEEPRQPTVPSLAPELTTEPPRTVKVTKKEPSGGGMLLGLTDEVLIIIIACSGAVIVIACVTMLLCYITMTRRRRVHARKPPVASPPTSQTHTDSTTSTGAMESPVQTLHYASDHHPGRSPIQMLHNGSSGHHHHVFV
eukprot:scpid52538/ scgid35761/ Leucine-rich repeats and immunoglobulin-like domains protein 3